MTGPEHYREAEVQLKLAGDDVLGSEMERYRIAKAQVHATLALAAATADLLADDAPTRAKAWIEVTR